MSEQNGNGNGKDEVIKLEESVNQAIASGFSPACAMCVHPASRDSVDVYFSSGMDAEAVISWFKDNYDREFSKRQVENHFDKHIVPHVRQAAFSEIERMDALMLKVRNKEGNHLDRLAMTREMMMESMVRAYLGTPQNIDLKEDIEKFKNLVKAQTDLSKAIRDTISMEFEIMGSGRSEEEQQELMENYMSRVLKEKLSHLSEFPEARAKLEEILGISQIADIVQEVESEDDL